MNSPGRAGFAGASNSAPGAQPGPDPGRASSSPRLTWNHTICFPAGPLGGQLGSGGLGREGAGDGQRDPALVLCSGLPRSWGIWRRLERQHRGPVGGGGDGVAARPQCLRVMKAACPDPCWGLSHPMPEPGGPDPGTQWEEAQGGEAADWGPRAPREGDSGVGAPCSVWRPGR